jgi:hypothetical protein
MALADVGAVVRTSAPSARCSFFGRHFVGHHQHHAVALEPPDQREAEAGVAGGGSMMVPPG